MKIDDNKKINEARVLLNMSPLELQDKEYGELRLFTIFFRNKDSTYRLVQSDLCFSDNKCIGSLNDVVQTIINKALSTDRRVKPIGILSDINEIKPESEIIYHCNSCWQGHPCIFKITNSNIYPIDNHLVCPLMRDGRKRNPLWRRRQ